MSGAAAPRDRDAPRAVGARDARRGRAPLLRGGRTRSTSPTPSPAGSCRSRPRRTSCARGATAGSRRTSRSCARACAPPGPPTSPPSSGGRAGTPTRATPRSRTRATTSPPLSGRSDATTRAATRRRRAAREDPARLRLRVLRQVRAGLPNDANFTFTPAAKSLPIVKAVRTETGWAWREDGVIPITQKHQIANFADFCNECGNCDVFCPEDGGPYTAGS